MYRLNVKNILRERKISQYKMAEDLGWNPAYLSLLINDKAPATLDNISKITDYLHLSIIDVIEEIDSSGNVVDHNKVSTSLNCPRCGKKIKITISSED